MQKIKKMRGTFLAFSLFSEPFCNSGISASAAKRLYSLVTRETVVHSHCTRRSKNLLERLFKQVSESNIAVMVQTARHHPAVGKHTYLVAQSITERLFGGILIALAVGPLEHIVKFKIDIFSKPPAVVSLAPWTRDILRK